MIVDKVNFKGSGSGALNIPKMHGEAASHKFNKELQNELVDLMPGSVKFLKKMSSFIGEVPNIIINAVGTAIVAPIFIKYNFLSKTDEDTRTYSALRQPLSAIIAVLVQAGVVIPLDRTIDNAANKGEFSDLKYNKIGYQDEEYLKKILRKANPNLSKEQLAELVESKQLEQMQTLINGLKANNNLSFISNNKTITLSEEMLRKIISQAVNDKLKFVNANIKRYETEKFYRQFSRGAFLRTNKDEVIETLDEIKKNADKAKSAKELQDWFKVKLASLKRQGANEELRKIVQEIKSRSNIDVVKEKIEDVRSKCLDFAQCSSDKEVMNKIYNHIEFKKAALKTEKGLIEEIRTMLFGGEKIESIMKKAEGFVDGDFGYDVVQRYIKNTAGNVKGLKQITAIVVGVGTLIVSCSLLNWSYPKIMDALFPRLSKSKGAKEKDQFIKNSEQQTNAAAKPDKKMTGEVQK